jgi:nitrite reductase/ring-hydroxylating ferredoxin subunit
MSSDHRFLPAALEPALLAGLIDYAGIFPPAQLALRDAVAEYRELLAGSHAAIVGPFLVRSSLLAELDRIGAPSDWPVGVVVDEPLAEAVDRMLSSTRRIVQIELPVRDADDDRKVADQLDRLSDSQVVFAEPAGTSPIADQVARIARLGRGNRGVRAKLRTGGVTAGSTVPDSVLAGFMVACHEHDLAWKATAGLHQPLRHLAASIGEVQHGFLNVLAAAWVVEQGGSATEIAAAIAATQLDELAIPPGAVRRRMVSFGSCSIDEPVSALVALGLTAAAAPVWTDVASSADLAPGATLAVEAFGQKLVAFRTHGGGVHVLGRFCTHLGANLARLGKVDGDRLRCGSHHWAYDATGRCVEAPGEAELPASCLPYYEVREVDGRIEVAGP